MRSVLWRIETRGAPCPGWPRLGKARNAASARHRTLPGGFAASGTARALRGAHAAPLAANASRLKVHDTL
ncbi:hypothetical protein XFF6166_520112 [Xanthomonas citri pv. fuscans]|nr:hypothetical protein XFF6166_520112 [Xanthomonas citri pv. fuscans]SOO01509.1 hypothetical protein XFF6960_480137 [Xanthomonas citri pv. fuscans]SOO03667.1 hypothetical protein XFF7767_180028 [Xanthomonas citri pv. fuscans]SOO10075.1 hypothetical protein XFF6970_490210 [Xanthomonas citri pv. fuscans]SOO14050.1 hypothetical protein XFF7766_260153 [Xanthomonas citri pv. fuscans]